MSQLVARHYAAPAGRRQLFAGISMAAVALLFGIEQAGLWLQAHPAVAHGLAASLMAGLATGLGALPVLFLRRPSEGLMAPLLGLAGGMMLAASLFSLLVPAVNIVAASDTAWPLGMATVAALLGGAWLMQQLDGRTAHAHVEHIDGTRRMPRIALVVAAIALHNVPEGLAVGVSAAAGADHGMTLGIAIQNIPEGWIVASAMLLLGAAPWRAAAIALATGLVEPCGGLLGALVGSTAGASLPLALAAAAGAMLWVVSHELIPASHRAGRINGGTAGLVGGFAVMTFIAAVF